MPQLVGVVLAGGAGRRLGRPKGDLLVEGRTLTDRAARALWPLCGNVLVSIAPGTANPAPAFLAVEDIGPAGRGPLAGIEAAFRSTGSADLLVLACDYPRVETSLLEALRDAARGEDDLVIASDAGGRDHPLVGFWRRRVEPVVREALESRLYKVRALLADVEVRRMGSAELPQFDLDHVLRNVNTLEDLR